MRTDKGNINKSSPGSLMGIHMDKLAKNGLNRKAKIKDEQDDSQHINLKY